jgi:hypothetical protein
MHFSRTPCLRPIEITPPRRRQRKLSKRLKRHGVLVFCIGMVALVVLCADRARNAALRFPAGYPHRPAPGSV